MISSNKRGCQNRSFIKNNNNNTVEGRSLLLKISLESVYSNTRYMPTDSPMVNHLCPYGLRKAGESLPVRLGLGLYGRCDSWYFQNTLNQHRRARSLRVPARSLIVPGHGVGCKWVRLGVRLGLDFKRGSRWGLRLGLGLGLRSGLGLGF